MLPDGDGSESGHERLPPVSQAIGIPHDPLSDDPLTAHARQETSEGCQYPSDIQQPQDQTYTYNSRQVAPQSANPSYSWTRCQTSLQWPHLTSWPCTFSQAPCFRQVGRGPLLLRCSCRHTTSEIHACYGRSATIARTTRQTELPQPSRYWAHAWPDRRLAHKHLARLTSRGTPGFIQEPHR